MTPNVIATIFSDIIFRPSEFESNSTEIWKCFTSLLEFMIINNEKIFNKDNSKQTMATTDEKISIMNLSYS